MCIRDRLGAEIYRGKAGQKFVFQMNDAEKAATRALQDRNQMCIRDRHRHMLLKTIVPKHSIGSKARCGLLLYKFRFFTSLIMPCLLYTSRCV